ncbi:MAG: efflux RND transporter permease subunit [Flavobacteriales bacterium]|nr:efflux RND transporter permease subunit [Flavobacteriales bacterium]
MLISRYAVKNYQFTLVIFLMIVVVGVTTLLNMPRAEDPDMDAPQFPVIAVFPGTSPEDMEDLVVDPLEKRIAALDNIKRIRTSISDGVAVLQVEYRFGSDVDEKYQELVREVGTARTELPPEIYSLEVQKVTPSNVDILQIALVSENASTEVLKREAERLQDVLEDLPMLKEVEISGLPEDIVRVDLRLEKLAQLHIPVNAVIGAIQSEVANIPGGSVEVGTKALNVKTSGSYTGPEDVANTVVWSANGRITLLRDVAEVRADQAEQKHITRLNGHRSVFVNAALKQGNNITQAQEKYDAAIEGFRAGLPANVDMVKHFDQADNVNSRLSSLGLDFAIAILLVMITLLPLGGRASLVVMISIPLSLAMGVVMLDLLGYTLNQLSIVGLVVALGLLVDDSIVVVENIERWIREGHSRMEATLKATNQIGMAVIGCTVTLIIAFMPLVFMPEASGEFIRSLPMAVILSVLASMLVSLTIVPFLSSRLLKEHSGKHEGNVFLQALQKGIHSTYAPVLNRSLNRPWTTIGIASLVFGGSLFLMGRIGFSLFPASEKPQFMVNIRAPLQSNMAHTDSLTHLVERELAATPAVKYFASNVGKGNPRVYYNVIQQNETPDFAQVFVLLQDDTPADEKLALIDSLRARFSGIPGAKIEVKNFEQGPPVLAPVEVRIFGENIDSLRVQSARVAELLRRTPGTLYVDDPLANLKSDVRLDIDREKASLLGIATVDIDRTVRMAVAGLPLGRFNDRNGDERTVLLTAAKGERADLGIFDDLYVNNRLGTAVPLRQVADIRLESSPLNIKHLTKKRYVAVSAFVQQGYLVDGVIADVETRLKDAPLPAGYTYGWGGEVESRQDSFGGFGTVIIATVFLFIAVLILEFRTFKSTLIVLSVIPLGIVGAVLALWLTGNSLSFVAIIGLIALAGIEVKNSILLVDFTNQLRAEGRTLDQAIREAGEIRFLPIVLTSLTAIGGLLPIAVSTNPLISPLAIVLIGGLISSTLLSRLVTPVIYKLIPPKVERMHDTV